MTTYLSFLALVLVITIAPGPDTALTLRASLVRGRSEGLLTMAGVSAAGAVQGLLAAGGLGAIIVASEPLFLTVKWVGAAYLLLLGAQALRAAWKGDFSGTPEEESTARSGARGDRRRTLAQGFLCNITNPKVLAFNLAVLPQFVGGGAGLPVLAVYALSLVAIGAVWLTGIVLLADRARGALTAPRARRRIEATMGVVMIGFGATVAATH
ncbi:lysine transporter LysE [Janibacter sp. Soil728]|uniref:LysE family translocator n=1 Tax=Janibacter sp. Soil728 TaxID=1736393 RepID=UPI0006F69502|nr:LysE family translocator [Janibacter sp. Soil728]KRE37285.1 lysine transporter LysE [Janibacter sp. Soil728]